MFQKRTLIHTLAVFLFLVMLFFIFKSTAKPWEASGHLILAVHAVPFDTADATVSLGIDDIELYHTDGSREKFSVRTRRVTLDPKSTVLEIVLNDTVPVGTYSGFGFTLKSPEIRNSWEEDTAPTPVSLPGERVVLMSPFHIEEDTTSALILAFETFQAIHEDGGIKVFLPVMQIETRFDTELVFTEDQRATLHGGTIESNATYGMDWDYTMRFNFRARPTRDEAKQGTLESVFTETSQEVTVQATSTPEETATSSSEIEADINEEVTASTTEEKTAVEEVEEEV
jgi:hypothetical protein